MLAKPIIQIDLADIGENDLVLLSARKAIREEMLSTCKALNLKNILEIDFFDGLTPYENLPESEYPLFIKCWYKLKTGKNLNLDHPKTFNEKIQWLKLYDRQPIKTIMCDKYLVRNYIKDQIGEEYLVPLLGVWDKFDDIDFDKLPNQFALKCNTGSEWNAIVRDKSKFDIPAAKKKFDLWMQKNPVNIRFLTQYKDVPLKIIAEKYLENENGDLFDYKFWCFGGKVKFIMFLSNRAHGLLMDNYDLDWNLLPFTYNYPNSGHKIEKPDNLDEMIALAEKLAAGFSHLRVDFYRLNDGSIKFGEFTFTSFGGVCDWHPKEMDEILGKLIKLPID